MTIQPCLWSTFRFEQIQVYIKDHVTAIPVCIEYNDNKYDYEN